MTLIAAAIASTTLAQVQPAPSASGDADEGEGGQTAAPLDHAAIVIVLDGARWQDVLLGVDGTLAKGAGLDARAANEPTLPRVMALARAHGAVLGASESGVIMRASGPNFVSLPGYSEILGGRPPTGCASNECPPAGRETFVDAVRSWSGAAREVAVFSSWPDLVRVSALHPEQVVVSGGRSVRHHEEILRADPEMGAWLDRGARSSAWPGEGDYRPDRYTAALAARYSEMAHPRFLFLSLGDTDEYAHRGDYAGYLQALRADDDAIADLVTALDKSPRGRQTTVYVTADHGRAADFRDHGGRWPESSRVWLIAIGDVGGVPFEATHRSRPEERRLAEIAPSVGAWLGMPADPTESRVIQALLPPEGPPVAAR
ncbi:MAG TPA: alkaline phosphatase family protein [Polyangiaceae bacterium]|jgi:hypothetical protein